MRLDIAPDLILGRYGKYESDGRGGRFGVSPLLSVWVFSKGLALFLGGCIEEFYVNCIREFSHSHSFLHRSPSNRSPPILLLDVDEITMFTFACTSAPLLSPMGKGDYRAVACESQIATARKGHQLPHLPKTSLDPLSLDHTATLRPPPAFRNGPGDLHVTSPSPSTASHGSIPIRHGVVPSMFADPFVLSTPIWLPLQCKTRRRIKHSRRRSKEARRTHAKY
ncbi:hypothetical protein DFH29DRAFT_937833 [Suillus ampliporus]|nr:hypothetical protein DFH29DRAFT_937833 [Suillus ampliporus]